MREINGIQERLDDLPGSEAPSRLTVSRASGGAQLSGVAKARRIRPGLRRGSPHPDIGWRSLAGSAPPGRPRGGPGSRKAAAFARRGSLKASGQRGPEPGSSRGERMFLASRRSLHKPNSALRSSQDMPHLRVSSACPAPRFLRHRIPSPLLEHLGGLAYQRADHDIQSALSGLRIAKAPPKPGAPGRGLRRGFPACGLAQPGGLCPAGQAPRTGRASGRRSHLGCGASPNVEK